MGRSIIKGQANVQKPRSATLTERRERPRRCDGWMPDIRISVPRTVGRVRQSPL